MYVPQARLMVIPSSWAVTPVTCRSIIQSTKSNITLEHCTAQLHPWLPCMLHGACKPPSQLLM